MSAVVRKVSMLTKFKEIYWWAISAIIIPTIGFGFDLYIEFQDYKSRIERLEEQADRIKTALHNSKSNAVVGDLQVDIRIIYSKIADMKEDIKDLKKK